MGFIYTTQECIGLMVLIHVVTKTSFSTCSINILQILDIKLEPGFSFSTMLEVKLTCT
jgi:hypothetical protein